MSSQPLVRMRRIKLVSNVSEHGLVRPLAVTRGRLVVSTLITTVVAIGFGILSARWIIESSASVAVNLLIITFEMMLIIVASYLQAVFVGDLFFTGPWREQVILGSNSAEGITVKNHNAEFMIVFLIAMAANTSIVNYGAGDFFDHYHNEAFFQVRLRSESPDERRAALTDLRDPMNYDLWERDGIRELVTNHLDDPDATVREEAIWNAGNMKIDTASREIAAILSNAAQPENVRVEAAHALGKLGGLAGSREALEKLLGDDTPASVRVAALRGLAMIASPLSVEAALPLTTAEDESVRVHAYWVLREAGGPELREMLRERLDDEKLSQREECALLDTLKMVANKDDIVWARRQYKKQKAGVSCEPVIWEDRNEHQRYVTYSDSFRVKYLKIVANADARGNIRWFHRLVADPEEETHVREVANEVLRRFDGGGY